MSKSKVWACLWAFSILASFGFALMPEELLGTFDNWMAGHLMGLSWAFLILWRKWGMKG